MLKRVPRPSFYRGGPYEGDAFTPGPTYGLTRTFEFGESGVGRDVAHLHCPNCWAEGRVPGNCERCVALPLAMVWCGPLICGSS